MARYKVRLKDKAPVTHEELLGWLAYDPATGIFRWRQDGKGKGGGRQKAGEVAGYERQADGYMEVCLRGLKYRAHRLAWFYVHGRWPKPGVDHRNGDLTDNSIENLREATQAQNCANKEGWRKGLKGTYFNGRKWIAQIGKNRVVHYLGGFDSEQKAHEVYVEAAKRLHGEFARI
jgi:hypothetical protein